MSILLGLGQGFVDLVLLPWHIWQWWQLETLKERMSALTLAGQSIEFLYLTLAAVLLIIGMGLISRRFLRGTVLGLESFNRTIGQLASWFVLLLMLQQVLIIVIGQVFRGNEILVSPLGIRWSKGELQWLSGQLKFYNAILISFASAYTFIEGGHVRVDLVYGALRYRARRVIDLLGSLIFMLPTTILLWWFAWPVATNAVFSQRPLNIFSDKASWRGVRLESSGTAEFTWVWAFKVLILVFAALLFLQAIAFLLRNLWALLDGDESIEAHPRDDIPMTPVPGEVDASDEGSGPPGASSTSLLSEDRVDAGSHSTASRADRLGDVTTANDQDADPTAIEDRTTRPAPVVQIESREEGGPTSVRTPLRSRPGESPDIDLGRVRHRADKPPSTPDPTGS